MSILPRSDSERKPRIFHGVRATVGWQLTADRVVFYCELCHEIFHVSVGHSRNDVRSSCPAMSENEKFIILNYGPVPVSILWSMYRKFMTANARHELDLAFGALDALIETEEVPL